MKIKLKNNNMKKAFLLIVIIVFQLSSYCQDSITVKIPDTAKVTVSKVYNDVKSGLSGLASALKVGADHVYYILIKQQIVKGVVYLSLFILSFLLLVYAMKGFKSKDEIWWHRGDECPTWVGVVRVIQLCIGGLIFSICCCSITTIATAFINPEYGAIKEIVDFVK